MLICIEFSFVCVVHILCVVNCGTTLVSNKTSRELTSQFILHKPEVYGPLRCLFLTGGAFFFSKFKKYISNSSSQHTK